jgi:hypothetical protein
MFIKNGDDPKSKIVVIDSTAVEELDIDAKLALDKMKEQLVKKEEPAKTKESN